MVCVRRGELLVIDALEGRIKRSVALPNDTAHIVRIARTGPGPSDRTILVKNPERAFPPHEYANPVWFYDGDLNLLKTADCLGAGHTPLVLDADGDGFDEFVIGYNLVDHDLETLWRFEPVPQDAWDAGEMHVDDMVVGDLGGRDCVVLAASDTVYVLEADTGQPLWERKATHPQHCQIGRFLPEGEGNQAFVHNKRAELQLFDAGGRMRWSVMPPQNFPLGAAEPCRRQKFHVFDPTEVLRGLGPGGTDLLIFSDAGWPYVLDGQGRRSAEFPYTKNIAQDWGEVPGRPDDYGYGFYVRVADFLGAGRQQVLINDRRFAWLYEVSTGDASAANATRRPSDKASVPLDSSVPPRSDGRVLNADLENYVDGVVQVLNAGVRWLGYPFSGIEEGTVEITRDFGFSGRRCAHLATDRPEQTARIQMQRRFDAPRMAGDTVAEVMYLASRDGGIDLRDLTVWSAESTSGEQVGLTLVANGTAQSGTYRLDVLHGGETGGDEGVGESLAQNEWVRIILHRRKQEGMVDLWLGPPGREQRVGSYPDLSPEGDLLRIEAGDSSKEEHHGEGYWDDFRIGGVLEPGRQVAGPEPALRDVGKELPVLEYPIRVGGVKQLFVDDAAIESAAGLERTLHPVRKHPSNPLFVADRPWEGLCVLIYGAVIRDPEVNRFRMWYLAWGKHVGQSSYICYAESEDGLHWEKPALGLHEFNGSTDNNIVIPDVTSNTTIIHDPRDPDPDRRYKAVIRAGGTHGYTSPDGLHWRDHGTIIDQCYDSTTVHWDPVGEKWIASVKIFRDGKRARGYAESRDFFNWSDTCFMTTVDERDASDDQMYAMIVFRYESVYLGLLRMFHEERDLVDVQLATSRNVKHWDRFSRTPFIPCSPEKGTWDYGNNSPGTDPPIRVGDELWFYYCGRSTTHGEAPNRGAIGLGTLRVDGFVSMDAGPAGGSLTTKPLLLAEDGLLVNCDARDGSLTVEILDESGAPIPPFSREVCVPVSEDAVAVPVRWRERSTVAELEDRPVRLRFHLENASLYAFWTEAIRDSGK